MLSSPTGAGPGWPEFDRQTSSDEFYIVIHTLMPKIHYTRFPVTSL